MLLDEPTLGLAPTLVDTIFDLLVEESHSRGRTVLVVEQKTHGRTLHFADRGYVLRTGRVGVEGSGAELAAHEDLFGTYVDDARRGRAVTTFVQSLVDGLGRGSTYALLALGITLIFGVMHLVNFAYAESITVGAYVAYFLSTNGVDWWLIAPAIVLAAVLAAVASELIAFRWVRNASPFTLLLTSFALERLSHALWAVFVSPTKKSFASPGWVFNTVEIGDVRFEVMDIVTIAVTAVVLAITAFVFRRTLFGLVGAGGERGLRCGPADGGAGQRGDRERVRLRRVAGGRGRGADPHAQPERRARARARTG